jgi:hypothetical protein
MLFGSAGAGKTTAAIQFPKPYVIDTERGAENDSYVDRINERGGALFQTTSFDDIVAEVRALASETHDYQTLIIDPVTVIYDDMVASWEKRVGTDFGRGYSAAKKEWKRLTSLLSTLDMNVVLTSHAKNLYAEGQAMKVLGQTFDGPKGADYYMDLVIEVQRNGSERLGRIAKSRIAGLQEGDVFPFSYDDIADRYGREALERNAKPVQFASSDLLLTLRDMLASRTDADALEAKWLRAAGCEDFSDMTSEQIEGCIKWLQK